MSEVMRTRNSASILRPLTTMNTISALLWTVYGLVGVESFPSEKQRQKVLHYSGAMS
jgi:uncharacterized protein with PQ loop repeat